MPSTNKIPKWYMVVSTVLLLWNLMGLFAFFSDMMVSPEALKAMPEATRKLYTEAPSWMPVVYAVAVFMGTIGCIGLVLQKAWALPVLILSFVAVFIQQYYTIFVAKIQDIMGSSSIILPILIFILSVFLIWFANKGIQKKWLT